jgi:hypothetical protein
MKFIFLLRFVEPLKMYDSAINGKFNKRKEWLKLKKNTQLNEGQTIAEGIDTEDELNRDATQEEIEHGDSTNVTVLSLDENDPS